MPQNLISRTQLEQLSAVVFLAGSRERLAEEGLPGGMAPFDDRIEAFLSDLSGMLLSDKEAVRYPDVAAFAFWIRKASVLAMKQRFFEDDGSIRMGRGTAFHIAPSNVPVNYAYSLAAGLLTGNVNIVRMPGRDFPQAEIINRMISRVLARHPYMQGYVYLVRYARSRQVNDVFSQIADTRIIWGGDSTVRELRKSPMRPRASEITFADRYSIAVIDSEKYLVLKDKRLFAQAFYNDTYLTDQNACTSPKAVVWTGGRRAEAAGEFWGLLHEAAVSKYELQPAAAVNKLAAGCLAAASGMVDRIEHHGDSYVVRAEINSISRPLPEFKNNAGFFFEYECSDLMEIRALCDDARCQTIGYLGDREKILPLLCSGIRGVDRVVPIGRTMDFDLIWDGYNLYERLTRIIDIKVR